MRELFAAFVGANKIRHRARQLALSQAWQTANLTNAAKLPPLHELLRKLEPAASRVMSPKQQRSAILEMATALGAEVVYRKKGEVLQ